MLYRYYQKEDGFQSDPTTVFLCVLKVPTMGHIPYKNIRKFHMHDKVEYRLLVCKDRASPRWLEVMTCRGMVLV